MTTSTQLRLRFPSLRKWVCSLSGSIKITLLLLLSFFTINTNSQIVINGQPGDWCTTLATTTKPHLHVGDILNGSGDDTEFNQGTKDVSPLNQWHWGLGNISAKTDLGNVGMVIDGACDLYFFADRYAAEGDADLGVWLFKDDVSLNPDGTFSGIHLDGDLLITSKFTNGGGTQSVRIYEWQGTNATGSLVLIYDSQVDNDLTGEQLSATVNTTTQTACFPYQGKNSPLQTYQPGTFFEAHINVCALIAALGSNFSLDLCFSNFIFKTSQSQEPNSANGDLVFGGINSIPAEKTVNGGAYCSGGTGFNITLSDADAGVSYQLQKQNGANWDNVGAAKTGADGSTIDFDGLQLAGSYRVFATTVGTQCTLVVGTAEVTVITANGGTGSADQAYCGSGDPTVLSVTGASTGTYQWQSNTTSCADGSPWANINQATGATYDPPAGLATTTYYRRVTTVSTCTANSSCITVTISAPATAAAGGPYTMCATSNSVTVVGTYGGSATGGVWSGGAGSFSNITPNTTLKTVTATYTPTAGEKAGGPVQLTFTANDPDGAGPCPSVAQNATLTISATPPPHLVVVNNCGTSTITAYVSSAGGAALVPAGELTWTGTNQTGNPINVTTTTAVTAIRTVGGCPSVASNSVTPAPKSTPGAPTGVPASGCIGQQVTISATGCSGTYKWYATNISATVLHTGASFTTPSLNESATYYVSCTVEGCEGPRTPVTASVTACGSFCTYTQGAWGSVGGKMCDGTVGGGGYSTRDMLAHALASYGGSLTVGSGSNTVTINNVNDCILDLLPGGGNSYALTGTTSGCANIKSKYAKQLNNGEYKINNTLLAQTITLGLNLGINDNLASFSFATHSATNKYLITAALTSCGSTSVVPNSNTCDLIDPAVIALLKQASWPASGNGDFPATVAGLYRLANYALGGGSLANTGGVTLESIAGVVDAINNAFDECRAFVGFQASCPSSNRMATPSLETSVVVTTSPNPYSDRIRFVITSKVSGQASLEVYNAMGQKIATPFRGYINAGRAQNVEYNVPASLRGNLFFKANVKDRFTSGKVVSLHK